MGILAFRTVRSGNLTGYRTPQTGVCDIAFECVHLVPLGRNFVVEGTRVLAMLRSQGLLREWVVRKCVVRVWAALVGLEYCPVLRDPPLVVVRVARSPCHRATPHPCLGELWRVGDFRSHENV